MKQKYDRWLKLTVWYDRLLWVGKPVLRCKGWLVAIITLGQNWKNIESGSQIQAERGLDIDDPRDESTHAVVQNY